MGHPSIFLALTDVKLACASLLAKQRLRSDPVTDAVLAEHALVLSRILRALRGKREDVVSDQLWKAIKKHWTSAQLLRAIVGFKTRKNTSAFLKLLPA